MQRVIKLRGRTGRFTTPSFLYTDNEPLVLKFDIAEHRNGKYVAKICCGTQEKTRHLEKDMLVEIPPAFIKAGEFNPIHVYLDYRTKELDKVLIPNDPAKGGFFIEPLYVEKVNGNTTFQAWASKIEDELKVLKEALATATEKIKQFEDEGVPLVAENEIEGE